MTLDQTRIFFHYFVSSDQFFFFIASGIAKKGPDQKRLKLKVPLLLLSDLQTLLLLLLMMKVCLPSKAEVVVVKNWN